MSTLGSASCAAAWNVRPVGSAGGRDGFEALVAACAYEPVATVRDLLAFWLDIDVLEEARDADAGGTRLCVEMSLPTRGWLSACAARAGTAKSSIAPSSSSSGPGVPWDPDTMHVASGDPADVPPA